MAGYGREGDGKGQPGPGSAESTCWRLGRLLADAVTSVKRPDARDWWRLASALGRERSGPHSRRPKWEK